MTRINTNISALTANQNLANSNNQLQTTLTRLSTGLRINSAADDPAGLIAATNLGSNIAASNQAISNSQVASQMISTADSALSQISSLLTTINGLITESANTSAESSSQIAANQLQIDSSLNAINSIAQTTNFQGQNLLDGSLGFLTQGTSANYASTVQNLQVNQVNLGAAASVPVNINVTAAATQATVTDSMTSGAAATATFSLGTGSITIDAPTGGSQYNGTTLQIQQSATVAAGTAVAAYDASKNTVTVTVNNAVGTTSNTTIAAAIAADTPFKVDANTAATGVYTSGGADPTSTLSALTATTTDGGVLQINSKNPNSAFDGTTIQFETNGTSATPKISFTGTPDLGTGTLTIQVDSTGTTTLQAIADAINNSTDAKVSQFAASVTTAGNFDPTVDGNTATTGSAAGATYNLGAATIGITANNNGLAANGVAVHVTVGGASTTAQYSSSTKVLTVNLAASSTITAAAINTAVTSALTGSQAGDVVAFQNEFTAAATGGDVITSTNGIASTASTADVEDTAGVDATAAEVVHTTVTDGVNTLQITMTGTGQHTADAGAAVNVVEAAPGVTATTATYDNSGAGTLTITLGAGQTVSSANIAAAIGAMSNNATFAARYGVAFSGSAAVNTAVTTVADQTTAGGANDTLGLGGTLAGGGISATFAGGTGSDALSGSLVMEVGSDVGQQTYSFVAGTTAADIVNAINQDSTTTGVAASINANGQLQLSSTNYGSAAYVNVNVVNDQGDFGSNLSATHAAGTDIQATVNNVAAIGQANTVSLNSPILSFSATLTPGTAANTNVSFNVNGGGALFQLGAVVTSSQQARLGIQNVDTNSLGGTVGRLYEIGSGQDASLTNDPGKAGQILQAALDNITSLRGRLGAFQTSTLDTNISTLTDAVTNLTAAQSSIQDADFAAESANLSREQILVQSGTTVAGIASSTPANVLSLLQKAAQV